MTTKPTGRRGRPVDEPSRQRRRQEILACAARVFARNGYPGTDMQAVADAAKVAKGTLYLYFEGKEGLFLAAVDQGMTSLRAAVDAAVEGLTDPLEVIEQAIFAYLRFFKEHPEQVELLILERAEFRDRKRSTYFSHREAGKDRWHDLLRGLRDAGRVRDVPLERIDDVVSDLVYGTMFTNHFSGRHKPLDAQARDILDIVYHGILSEQERRGRTP
ncbi:MAG: TetR/AcrR family transcriptional regulator [Gemmataceae bacterium]